MAATYQAGVSPILLALGWIALTPALADQRTSAVTPFECLPQKPPGDPRWWSFRQDVDGVRGKCWYPGRPGKSKSHLHWTRRFSADRRPEDVQNPVPRGADPNQADTCCWPPLEEPPPPRPAEPSFNERWNDLLNDMAMPVSRWRAPLKDQQRFNGD